ncbi:hypothetical protein FQR65_LT19302 [Abscondita terminalis]|nr:hypothetical protein FQR65_LT19302 [Abscondita terminalis]
MPPQHLPETATPRDNGGQGVGTAHVRNRGFGLLGDARHAAVLSSKTGSAKCRPLRYSTSPNDISVRNGCPCRYGAQNQIEAVGRLRQPMMPSEATKRRAARKKIKTIVPSIFSQTVSRPMRSASEAPTGFLSSSEVPENRRDQRRGFLARFPSNARPLSATGMEAVTGSNFSQVVFGLATLAVFCTGIAPAQRNIRRRNGFRRRNLRVPANRQPCRQNRWRTSSLIGGTVWRRWSRLFCLWPFWPEIFAGGCPGLRDAVVRRTSAAVALPRWDNQRGVSHFCATGIPLVRRLGAGSRMRAQADVKSRRFAAFVDRPPRSSVLAADAKMHGNRPGREAMSEEAKAAK